MPLSAGPLPPGSSRPERRNPVLSLPRTLIRNVATRRRRGRPGNGFLGIIRQSPGNGTRRRPKARSARLHPDPPPGQQLPQTYRMLWREHSQCAGVSTNPPRPADTGGAGSPFRKPGPAPRRPRRNTPNDRTGRTAGRGRRRTPGTAVAAPPARILSRTPRHTAGRGPHARRPEGSPRPLPASGRTPAPAAVRPHPPVFLFRFHDGYGQSVRTARAGPSRRIPSDELRDTPRIFRVVVPVGHGVRRTGNHPPAPSRPAWPRRRIDHPCRHEVVRIAVDEEHRQLAFGHLPGAKPRGTTSRTSGRTTNWPCRAAGRRAARTAPELLAELVPDARITAVLHETLHIGSLRLPETIIVVAAPIEMPCTTIRVRPPKSPLATSIHRSTSRRSFHPMRMARPSLSPW